MEVDISQPTVIPPFHRDPFSPVLFEAVTPVTITSEQENLVRQVLVLTSSDSRFAQKAADALRLILLGGEPPVVPKITTVAPPQRQSGTASLALKVNGSGFDSTCVIHINGNAVPTTFTSTTELNTNINLVGVAAGAYPVVVRHVSGILSNQVLFTVTALELVADPPPPPPTSRTRLVEKK